MLCPHVSRTPCPRMSALPRTPPSPAGAQRRGGLVQAVVAHLQQQIQSGQLKPGDKLPSESAVMQALRVSRTVVR